MIAFIIDDGNGLLARPSRHKHGDGQSNSVMPTIRNKQLHCASPVVGSLGETRSVESLLVTTQSDYVEPDLFGVVLGDILAMPLLIHQEDVSEDSVARPHEGELHVPQLLLDSTPPTNLDQVETVYVTAKLDVCCFHCNSPR